MTYLSTSVLGGWQTQEASTGRLFGPVFNSCTDLWNWQRGNLVQEPPPEHRRQDNPSNNQSI